MLRKRLLIAILTLCVGLSSLAFVGCNNDRGPREGELLIRAFEGGFGRAWLYDALEEYRTLNPEFRFHVEWDPSIVSTVTTRLSADVNLPDLFFTQPFNWRSHALENRLLPLNDVFAATAYYDNGEAVTISDFIADGFEDSLWLRRTVDGQQVKTNPYIVPWSVNSSSFAYNEALLRLTRTTHEIPGITANGFWVEPPVTTQQLQWLVADINTTQAANGYATVSGNDSVTPFVWPGQAQNWLTFVHTNWWAQYQGLDGDGPNGEGNWYDFWNFHDINVFRQSGLIRSYDMLRSLVTDQNGNWTNVPTQFGSWGTTRAQTEFVRQRAVMIPVGSWIQREMDAFIGNPQFIATNDLRMMTLPNIEGARSTNLNNADLGHFMAVPANALNTDLAVSFLKFLNTRDQAVKFTQATGMMRPFNYDPLALAPDHAWTPFTRDIIGLWTNHTNFFEMSTENHPFFVFDGLGPYVPTIADIMGDLPRRNGNQLVEEVIISWINQPQQWNQWHTNHGLTVNPV